MRVRDTTLVGFITGLVADFTAFGRIAAAPETAASIYNLTYLGIFIIVVAGVLEVFMHIRLLKGRLGGFIVGFGIGVSFGGVLIGHVL